MKWLPNALTISRIFIAPFITFFALKQSWQLALCLILIAWMTDFFDGLLAKELDAETKFGKIFDPICDAAMAAGAVCGLIFQANVLHNILFWGIPILIVGFILKFLKHQKHFPRLNRLAIPTLPFIEFIMIIAVLYIYADHALHDKIIFAWISGLLVAPLVIFIKRHRFNDWLSGRL